MALDSPRKTPHTDEIILMTHTPILSSRLFARFAALGTIVVFGLLSAGCESSSSVDGVAWNADGTPAETPIEGEVPGSSGDMVSFGSLNWTYGGFDGSGASHTGVNISGLSFDSDNLFFRYNNDLSAWGVSHTDWSQALACLFVKNSAGQWVGGKFDWISSSRTSRDFHNVKGGYIGWTLGNVPNPCEAAFVIVHIGGRRRSNVITGTWTR